MSPEEIKRYDDPLMGRMSTKNKSTRQEDSKEGGPSVRKPVAAAALAGLLAVMGALGYFLYDARRSLDELGGSLVESRQQLDSSQTHLQALEGNLNQSREELQNQQQEISRYKTLYRDLKQQQSDQSQELEAIAIRKADQAAVDALADQTTGLQGEVGEIQNRVGQINTNISDLREQTTSNRAGVERTQASVNELRLQTQANSSEIAAVKNSLERDYYSFELQKNGSVIKVFDVALSLKDTDFGKQRFHVEIVAGGKRLRKKGQAVNEPIFFYVEGKEKPYELVVNRVDKKFVTGHLSVPKG